MYQSTRKLMPEVDCEIVIHSKKVKQITFHQGRVKRGPNKGKRYVKYFIPKLFIVRGKHRSPAPDSQSLKVKGIDFDFHGD